MSGAGLEEVLAAAEAAQRAVAPFARLTPGLAREQAARLDPQAPGPLAGVALTVKDVIDVAGVPTELGTPGAGHHTPAADATAVARAVAAGAVVVGKATTHELAFGMVTPQTRNPFDPSRIVGGSSGGSAAAVAAGGAELALGTDTNGSIRCPAALCGVVGLKPTHGDIPRDGVAPLAWSQDTVGVLAPTVAACATAFNVLATRSAAADTPPPRRLGVDADAWGAVQPAVERACREALAGLEQAGIEVVGVSLPDLGLAGSASIITLIAEAAAAWGDELERRPDGFGPQVRAALRAGTEVTARDYLRARRVRRLVRDQLAALRAEHGLDAIALPALPVTAAPAGAATVSLGSREQPLDAAQSRYTALASLTGDPALSVPCGLDDDGLPIGLQLIGAPRGEPVLLALATFAERLPGAEAVAAARRRVTDALRTGAG